MSIFPQRMVITGTGKPRLIKEISATDTEYYLTTGSPTYTATTITDSIALTSQARVGKRVRAIVNNTGFAGTIAWAKILSVDTGTKTITIDEWIGGTPTNTNVYKIDGYIADLPRSESLVEIFKPDTLIHNIIRRIKNTKGYGYEYECRIGYSNFVSTDMLYEFRDVMKSNTQGDLNSCILVPRKDKSGINYEVYLSSPIELSLSADKKGYKGTVLNFIGKRNISIPPHMQYGGYGTNYGSTYGTCL